MEFKGRCHTRVISEKEPRTVIEFSINAESISEAIAQAKDFIAFQIENSFVARVVAKAELLIEGNWREISI